MYETKFEWSLFTAQLIVVLDVRGVEQTLTRTAASREL